ncbi:MAG: hypothetical protein AAB495_03170 [Patescibacteria group bacterium]
MSSSPAGDLGDRYWALRLKKEPKEIPRIHVDEVASQVSSFYERARNIIDYQEEHLLRKHFIARTLRRRLALQKKQDAAEPLVKDIVRAGHLSNDAVPETKIAEVQRIINAYRSIGRALKDKEEMSREMGEWVFKITASAIEECLFPPAADELIAEFMFASLREGLTVHHKDSMSDDEVSVQLFIAVQKALLRVDADQLQYRLLGFIYPDWVEAADSEKGAEVASSLPKVKKMMKNYIQNQLGAPFLALANRYNTVFHLIGDVMASSESQEDLARALRDPQELEPRVKIAYQKRFSKEKRRLRKFALLSVISFFISKIAVALAVEIPLEKYFTSSFSATTTAINILFPPLLMFVIVLFVRMPPQKNRLLVFEEIKKVLFGEGQTYEVVMPRARLGIGGAVVRLFYAGLFVALMFAVSRALFSAGFNIPNIIIFVIFTSLVAATGVRVHNRASELSLREKKPTIISFLWDIVVMPFVTIGTWIIRALARFNVVVFLFNMLIDFPLQIFVEFIENFRDFIRGKKDAMR